MMKTSLPNSPILHVRQKEGGGVQTDLHLSVPARLEGWLLGLVHFNVCLFVLRFYGPVNPMGSCRMRSVYLATRLLGRLSPLRG